jgi:DNA-binding FadR family transcriptional regulator
VHALGSDAGPRAADDVAERIRALLGTGGVTAGQRLPSERDLATRLGVSRPAVREGLRRLEQRRLIEPRARSGTFAAVVDLPELFAVRLRLEPLAAGLAARHRSAEDLRALRRLLDELHEAHEEPESVARVDAALHRALAVAGRNAVLLHLLDDLAELSALSRRVTSPDAATRTRAAHDLAAVVEAVEAQDEAAAEAAMRRHLDAVRAAVSGPDRPEA